MPVVQSDRADPWRGLRDRQPARRRRGAGADAAPGGSRSDRGAVTPPRVRGQTSSLAPRAVGLECRSSRGRSCCSSFSGPAARAPRPDRRTSAGLTAPGSASKRAPARRRHCSGREGIFSRDHSQGRPAPWSMLPQIAVAIGLTLGAAIGILAGYLGGPFDAVATRILDVQLAIPGVICSRLLIVTGFGRGDAVVVGGCRAGRDPRFARVAGARRRSQSQRATTCWWRRRAARASARSPSARSLPGVFRHSSRKPRSASRRPVLAIASLSFRRPSASHGYYAELGCDGLREPPAALSTHPLGGGSRPGAAGRAARQSASTWRSRRSGEVPRP